jgi:hypothetical protein
MSNWWARFGAAGVQTEAEAAAADDPMAPGSMPMIVGVYVGLVMGTMHPRFAGRIRRELEAEMAAAIGVPPEALEEDMRQLVASLTGAGR